MSKYDKMFNDADVILQFIENPESNALEARLYDKYLKVRAVENWRNQRFDFVAIKGLLMREFNLSSPATAQTYINLYLEIKEKGICLAPLVMVNEAIDLCDKIILNNLNTKPELALKANELKLKAAAIALENKPENRNTESRQPIVLYLKNSRGLASKINVDEIHLQPVEERNKLVAIAQDSILEMRPPGIDIKDAELVEPEDEERDNGN